MSGPIRIMIVEDHAVVRQGLAALLAATPDFSIVAQAAATFLVRSMGQTGILVLTT